MNTLLEVLSHYGPRPALALDGRVWTYAEVLDASADLAATVQRMATDDRSGVIGLMANKSFAAYAGAVGAHLTGRGYVPLNPKFPAQRLADMARRSGTRTVIVGPEGLPRLGAFLAATAGLPLTILGFDVADFADLDAAASPAHRFALVRPGRGLRDWEVLPDRGAAATAYLLFTSGSTGTPKGVPVSFANLDAYVGQVGRTYPLGPEDRVSQTFDMTFDLSVHDLFMTWSAGACLCPLNDLALLNPAKFIRDMRLSAWFSVPAVAMLMDRIRTLRPGLFPSLRLSLFCGEPLPATTTDAWAAAAPGSRVVNLYGPTEATIAIAAHEWDAEGREGIDKDGIVPIGRVFPSQRHCLLAEDGRPVLGLPGRGELCLNGSQVTAGYLADPGKTAERYISLPSLGPGLWYRTGDLVEADARGVLHFCGRLDHQVKINGYRVELGEVEAALRTAAGAQAVVALPWPGGSSSARGLVAFIMGRQQDATAVLDRCRRALPEYMVPMRIIWKQAMPLNANGKIDRLALAAEVTTRT